MDHIRETIVTAGSLDTVRALHQTIVALRVALERSRLEVARLKAHKHVRIAMDNILIPDLSVRMSSTPDISTTQVPHAGSETNVGSTRSEPALLNLTGELDDIDLIFTTDESGTDLVKFEELVPIETSQPKLSCPQLDLDGSYSDDEVFHKAPADPDLDRDEKSCYSLFQDSSFENRSIEKDESFDRFEEDIGIIETDISKCGIGEPVEYSTGRRNTCPNPLQYRPLIHRDALGKRRPILIRPGKCESAAQTDITALPRCHWRSESSLANKSSKSGDKFPTLPSKFPMPGGSRLRLSEKTDVEARRILLSDIGFTSMVPELSRSADHLYNNIVKQSTPVSYGQYLHATDLCSPAYTSSRPRFGSVYPSTSRRFSAPVSPNRRGQTLTKIRCFANGSLPELCRTFTDSGGSTDSLLDEAENYLRSSVDCVDLLYKRELKKCGYRRASAPEPAGDSVPPQDWHPFLPRSPRDLRLDHWIKIIVPEGRVRGGRVRYIGGLLNQDEQYVGVQLSTPDGYCDGSYNNRRYFNCEPYHGVFVLFKKVVMGWRP